MSSTAKHAFALNLRRLMRQNDVDNKDIAKLVDRNERTVRRWLDPRDPSEPNITQMMQLSVYLGSNPQDMMREVAEDWSKFGGGAFDACRIAMSKERLLEPGTGVLLDYLVLGTWVDERISKSFYNAILTNRFGSERLYIDNGKIIADGIKVGIVKRSQGNTWDGKRKFLWHFTGKWFKRPENGKHGGVGYTDSDAFRFMMDVINQLVSKAHTATGEQDKAAGALTDYDTSTEMLEKIRIRASNLDHQDFDAVYKLVSEMRDIIDQADDLKDHIVGNQRNVTWSDLTEMPIRNLVIPRVDYALEITIDPDVTNILKMRDFILPREFQWRQTITSADGETVYAGPSKNPLKYRGEKPMLAVYREKVRPDKMRMEVRVPNVTYHNPKQSFGVREASELARDVLAALVPWDINVDYHHESYNDDVDLSVPCLAFDPLPCVLNPVTGLVPNKPFNGHHVNELKRITNQGFTCTESYGGRALVAYIFARTPLEELNPNAPTPIHIDGVNLSIPPELVQAAYNATPTEDKMHMEQVRRTLVEELRDIHIPPLERIEGLVGLLCAMRRVAYPSAGAFTPEDYNPSEEVIQGLIDTLTEDPYLPEWPSGREYALFIDDRGYDEAHDYDQAERRLHMFHGEDFKPIEQPAVYHD